MTISMYQASVPVLVQFLTSLAAILDKAAAHAEAKKIDPSVLLNTRLYPDMFPLVRQVRAATDHAVNAGGRLAGAELPTFANTEASIPELKERIGKAIDFLKGLEPSQIDGSEDREIKITFPSGATREFAELLFPLHHRLRHPASLRGRAWQARLHGRAGEALKSIGPGQSGHARPAMCARQQQNGCCRAISSTSKLPVSAGPFR
jgi:hypothetical protein